MIRALNLCCILAVGSANKKHTAAFSPFSSRGRKLDPSPACLIAPGFHGNKSKPRMVTLEMDLPMSETGTRSAGDDVPVLVTFALGIHGCASLDATLLGMLPAPLSSPTKLFIVMNSSTWCPGDDAELHSYSLCTLCALDGVSCEIASTTFADFHHRHVEGSHGSHETALLKLDTPRYLPESVTKFILIDADATFVLPSSPSALWRQFKNGKMFGLPVVR